MFERRSIAQNREAGPPWERLLKSGRPEFDFREVQLFDFAPHPYQSKEILRPPTRCPATRKIS
jgi:hypothetical protein